MSTPVRAEIISNAPTLARRWTLAGAAVPDATARGVRKVVFTVETAAEKLLRGAGTSAPGTYPVPVRFGFLRRSLGATASGGRGLVFNSAQYARAIHDGFRPYGNPHARPIPARPFMDDALATVDAGAIMAQFVVPA